MVIKASINKMPLNSKDLPNDKPVKHVSLELIAKASKYPELIDLETTKVAISDLIFLVEEHQLHFVLDQNNIIRRENYNISFAGSFNFKGQSFRSAKIKMVKDIGAVICLGINVPYDKNFLVWCAENYRPDLIEVTIDQVKSKQTSLPGAKPLKAVK